MKEAYQQALELIKDDFDAVDQVIHKNLHSEVALINTLSNYVISSGGKRLRPILTLLCGRAVSDQPSPKLSIAAAIIEYIHTATLIHDDVVDNSDQRRGKDTANNVWGNEAAVLVGDFLYSRAFQLMQQLDSLPIQNLFAEATNKIAEGEVLQLLNVGNADLTEETYFDIITAKTAVLFSTACEAGALVAGADQETAKAFAQYGNHLGIAFQIIDDTLDYEGNPEVIGKNLGDDLAEGKVTLPIIKALEMSDSEQRETLISAIKSPNEHNLNKTLKIITQHNALQEAQKLALHYSALANLSLEQLNDNHSPVYIHTLISIATKHSQRNI